MSTPLMPEAAGQNLPRRPRPTTFQPAPAPALPAPSAVPQLPQANTPPPSPVSPDQIKAAHTHVGAVIDGLISLANRPKGELTKKDVFDAASTMIARGAFPTPESKQDLITKLAAMPDDETGIRNAVGGFLMDVAANRNRSSRSMARRH